jgi:hypothetical protein
MLPSVKNGPVLRSLALALLLASATACQGSKVSVLEVDGVRYVTNPAEPTRPNMTIEMEELFRIGDDDTAGDEYIFTFIGGIAVGEDHRIYVQVAREDIVNCYDGEGEYIRTIGRQGQGPGEMYLAQGVSLGPDGNLWVPSMGSGRLVLFTPDGEFLRNITFTQVPPLFIQTTSDGFMGIHLRQRLLNDNVAEITYMLRRFNTEGDTLNTLFDRSVQLDITDLQLGGVQENIPLYTLDGEGRIWQSRPRSDLYQINVFNPDGTMDMVVEKDVPPIPKSQQEIDEERETVMRLIEQQAGGQLPPDFHLDYEPDPNRAFLGIPYYDPAGYIWAQVSREGTHDTSAFDLFDESGRFLQRIQIEGVAAPAFLQFVDDRLYLVESDPEGIPQVIVYRIEH